VPPDAKRLQIDDLMAVMERLRVDWALFTPSVAALLKPKRLPTPRTLVLRGGSATPALVKTWAVNVKVHLTSSFSPAETSNWCHVHPLFSAHDIRAHIGKPAGCAMWILDSWYPRRPLPVGAVREMITEGPSVAAGYYEDGAKTRQAFLDSLP
jgi:non-ribosomal peptide synthetase component F